MINTILSVMFPGFRPFNTVVLNDVAFPWAFLVIGAVAVIIIGVVIVLLIVFAVRFLTRIRNKSGKTPQ